MYAPLHPGVSLPIALPRRTQIVFAYNDELLLRVPCSVAVHTRQVERVPKSVHVFNAIDDPAVREDRTVDYMRQQCVHLCAAHPVSYPKRKPPSAAKIVRHQTNTVALLATILLRFRGSPLGQAGMSRDTGLQTPFSDDTVAASY